MGGTIRILYAGDSERQFLDAVEKCGLPRDSLEILTEETPSEAAETAGCSRSTIVFADFAPSDMTEAVAKIRAADKTAAICALARPENLSVELILRLLDNGVSRIIPKDDSLPKRIAEAVRESVGTQCASIPKEFLLQTIHELKSPLVVVANYLEMLKKNPSGPRASEQFRRAVERVEGMKRLVGNLSEIGRLDSTAQKVFRPVNVLQMASALLEDYSAAAKKKNIALSLKSDGEVSVNADERDVESIIGNLLDIAVKYSFENGSVELSVKKDGDTVSISVSDTGPGISGENQKLLFKEFSRIRDDATRRAEGSGLGLTIVKRLCALHRGDISVESIPGKGCVFTAKIKSGS